MIPQYMQGTYKKRFGHCKLCDEYFILLDNRGREPSYCKTCKPIHNRDLDRLRKQRNKKEVA
jgi:hypothetical protein